jgi:hypothetical protein
MINEASKKFETVCKCKVNFHSIDLLRVGELKSSTKFVGRCEDM